MFPWLWHILKGSDAGVGLSARSMGAVATAFFVGWVLSGRTIRLLRHWGITDRPKEHGGLNILTKSGVPTMGGALILFSTIVSAVIWCDITSGFVWIVLAAGLYFGVVGAVDDILCARGKPSGLSHGAKYAAQIAFGVLLAVVILYPGSFPAETAKFYQSLYLPFFHVGIHLGLWIVPIVVFFIVFASNSVNLTDGMDGLAIVPVIFVALVLGVFAYIAGRSDFSNEFRLYGYVAENANMIRGAGELTVLCAAVVGSGAAFLWHNAHPAGLFMGDTGSLALGGMLGTAAVLIRQEVVFLIAGGLLVAELASSFIQHYIGLKLLGRRIFPRAPLHLALLHRGLGETKVTIRLWIVAAMCALVAVGSLKLRGAPAAPADPPAVQARQHP